MLAVGPRVDATPRVAATGADSDGQWVARLESEHVVARNAATRRDYPRDACVHQLFAAHVVARPAAVAVAAPDGALSYFDLEIRANQLANRLRSLGVGPEVLVGLCLERSAAQVVGALGILKSGGAYVALDPSYPAERLSFMLRDARVPVLVTSRAQAQRLDAGTATVIALDDPEGGLETESPIAPPTTVTAGNLAYVIYTSGSTGAPKGVMIEHGSLLNLVFWHRREFAVTASDRATLLPALRLTLRFGSSGRT